MMARSAFDIYAEVEALVADLEREGALEWAHEIRESMLKGATSGEVLGDIKLALLAYAASADVKPTHCLKADQLISEINRMIR